MCHRLDKDNDVAWPPNHACLRHGMMPCGRWSLTWTSWSAMILSVCKDVKRLSSSMKILRKIWWVCHRRDNDSDVAWAPNHACSRHDMMPCGRWSLTWTSWFWASDRTWIALSSWVWSLQKKSCLLKTWCDLMGWHAIDCDNVWVPVWSDAIDETTTWPGHQIMLA